MLQKKEYLLYFILFYFNSIQFIQFCTTSDPLIFIFTPLIFSVNSSPFFPPSCFALTLPTPPFSPTPANSLCLSVHGWKSLWMFLLEWLFVWVTMWVCYWGGEGEGERESEKRGEEERDWTWPCGWCFGSAADLQEWVSVTACNSECVWDGIHSGQKTSSWQNGQKN